MKKDKANALRYARHFYFFYKNNKNYFWTKDKATKILSIAIPILIMSLLTVINLGNREMWFDEAHNVAIGENVVKYGIPRVWDGKNLIGLGQESFINFVEVYLNWFPYYLAAWGQLFSRSLFSIRIWFVVFGLASALCLYFMTYENFKNRNLAVLSLWLYCLSVPVIIYIKVAYYYAPSLLFINLSYLCFLKAMHTGKEKYFGFFAISMTFLLYSNYLFFCIFMVFSAALYIFVYRCHIKKYIISMLFTGILISPYAIARIYHMIAYGFGYQKQDLNGFLLQFPGQFWQIQAYFFPFITYGVMIIIKKLFLLIKEILSKQNKQCNYDNLLISRKKISIYYIFFFLLIILNAATVSFLTLDYATRYLIISIPFCCIFNAAFIVKYFEKDKAAKIAFIILLITTNIIQEFPYFVIKDISTNSLVEMFVKPPVAHYESTIVTDIKTLDEYKAELKIKSYLFTYISTYLKDYDCSEEGAVLFLKRYAKDDETFLCLTISKYQILYHLNLKLVQTDNSDAIIMNEEYIGQKKPITWARNLKYYSLIYRPIEYIDWVIVNPEDIDAKGNEFISKEIYEKLVDTNLFERYDLPEYTCVPFSADIWSYTFETDLNYQGVTIFRNKNTTDTIDAPNIISKSFLEN